MEELNRGEQAVLVPGTSFCSYQIGRKLGDSHERRTTYRATHLPTRREVALKVFAPAEEDAGRVDALFADFTSRQAGLGLTGVMPLLDSGSSGGLFYTAVEWVEGGSLRDLLDQSPAGLDLPTAQQVFAQVAESLEAYHQATGRCHHDLKPENILLQKTGKGYQACITDFWTAEILDSCTASPFHTAPEAWGEDSNPGRAADVYALGSMLFEALEGQPPFEDGIPSLSFQHRFEPAPFPERIEELAGALAVDTLLGALEKQPDERPATAVGLIEQFNLDTAYFLANQQAAGRVGQAFSGFLLEEVIESDLISVTFQARDGWTDAPVVLCLYPGLDLVPEAAEDFQDLEDLLREISRSPVRGASPILRVERFGDCLFAVTGRPPGGTLRDWMKRSPAGIDFPSALDKFALVAEALDQVHAAGCIHGELRPEAVTFTQTGDSESAALRLPGHQHIIDFLVGEEEDPPPAYRPPRGRSTRLADVYALAAMMVEALAGPQAFAAKRSAARQAALRKVETGAGPEAVIVFKAALAAGASPYTKSAGDWIAALKNARSTFQARPAPRPEAPRRFSRLILPATGIAAVLLGLGLYLAASAYGIPITGLTATPPGPTVSVPTAFLSPTSPSGVLLDAAATAQPTFSPTASPTRTKTRTAAPSRTATRPPRRFPAITRTYTAGPDEAKKPLATTPPPSATDRPNQPTDQALLPSNTPRPPIEPSDTPVPPVEPSDTPVPPIEPSDTPEPPPSPLPPGLTKTPPGKIKTPKP